eukprot:5947113-Amphidinium_carterae.1
MSSSAQVGHFVGFQVALKVLQSDPSFIHSFTSLVGLNPLEPAVLSEGSRGSLFKGFDHTFAVIDNTAGLAFFQSPNNR